MFNRINFNTENKRVVEEIAEEIKYMMERKFELERKIRIGLDAAKERNELEKKLKINMIAYISAGEEVL